MKEKLEIRSFIFMLLAVTLAFGWVLKPFWMSIFWACTVAIIFYPLQRKMQQWIGEKPNRAALLTLSIAVVIVVLPVLGVAYSFVQEGVQVYQKLDSGEIRPGQFLQQIETAFPFIPELLERFGVSTDNLRSKLSELAVTASRTLAQQALSVGQNTFSFVVSVALMVYLTFFLLRDGHLLVDLMVRALPLGDERERELFAKFAEVARATVKGNIVVAAIQGALGGLIFALLGLPGALLWGVVMAFLSLIPAIGAGLLWLPVAVYLLAMGSIWKGLILIAFGAIVIGLADNILRPILVGRDTKIPDYVVLFSTLGGLTLFGITGFVVGPLVAALFMAFWAIFMREFNTAD